MMNTGDNDKHGFNLQSQTKTYILAENIQNDEKRLMMQLLLNHNNQFTIKDKITKYFFIEINKFQNVEKV